MVVEFHFLRLVQMSQLGTNSLRLLVPIHGLQVLALNMLIPVFYLPVMVVEFHSTPQVIAPSQS
jgi:hypothetical protein